MNKVNNSSLKNKPFGYVVRFIEPCILLLLSKGSFHGYGLMEDLEKHCGEKVDIGNLYRTLRRMERVGWTESNWEENTVGPDRRTYVITKEGREFLKSAASSLIRTDKLIHRFLDGYQKNFPKGQSI